MDVNGQSAGAPSNVFSFGSAATAPAATTQPATTSAPSMFGTQPGFGFSGFGFGTASQSTTSTVAPTSFGFGLPATAPATNFGSSVGSSTTSGSLPSLSFAAPTPSTTAGNTGFSFGMSQPAPAAAAVAPAFSFGNPTTTATVPASSSTGNSVFSRLGGGAQPAATTSSFSFGGTPTAAPSWNVPSVSSTAAPALGFGFGTVAPVSTAASTSLPSLGFGLTMAAAPAAAPTTTAASSLFSFGTPSQPAPVAPTIPTATAPAPFSFLPTTSTTSQPAAPTFGFSLPSMGTTTAAAPSSFSFNPAPPVTTTAPSAFSFNPAPPVTTAPTIPASGSTGSSIFSRLGGVQPAAPTASFSFGTPAASTVGPVPSTLAAPPSFAFNPAPAASVAVTSAPTRPTLNFGLTIAPTAAASTSGPGAASASLFNFGTPSQPAALNLSLPTTTSAAAPATFSFLPTTSTSQPAPAPTGFSLPSIVASTSAIPASTAASFTFGLPPAPQPTTTPLTTAVTTVVSSTPATIPTVTPIAMPINLIVSTGVSTTGISVAPITTTASAAGLTVLGLASDISEEDKKLLDRFKKMTYEDFESYLEDTKRAVDQLEESWIRGTLKLNAFLSMRKDNTKAMRLLREKLAVIWEFENKVERTLAAVSLSIAEIEETLSYLEKNATDPDDFFKKNARRISAEDRYRANCYKTLDLLYREVRIALSDVDSSRKKLMRNLIKEDEVRDLLTSKQMLSGQFEPKLLMENPHILGTIAAMLMKDIKEVKNGQRQALTKLRFQKAQAEANSR